MPSYNIRTMTVDDLHAVSTVDLAAFTVAAQRAGLPAPHHARHRMGLECFRRTASDLCIVAEANDGEVVGYCIGHRWGNTSWVGPLGVLPDYMARGIGTALMKGFCSRSIEGGAEVVGLETSIAQNVRLYEKQGFLARGTRLLAGRDLDPGMGGIVSQPLPSADRNGGADIDGFRIVPWSALGHTGQRARVIEARALAQIISPGLDHTAEFDVVPKSGIGATYLALDSQGKLAGYAVMHLRTYRSPDFHDQAPPIDPFVWILVGSAKAAGALLGACEAAAIVAGAVHLRVPCYGGNPHAWAVLRQLGYRVEMAYVRMTYRGDYAGTSGRKWDQVPLDLSSWLG